MKWFLAMRIIRDRDARKIWICQDSYVDKIVAKYNLQGRKSPDTPLSTDDLVPFQGTATPQEVASYQSKVGSIIYPTSITRPDIAFASSRLASFMQNPSPTHQLAAE